MKIFYEVVVDAVVFGQKDLDPMTFFQKGFGESVNHISETADLRNRSHFAGYVDNIHTIRTIQIMTFPVIISFYTHKKKLKGILNGIDTEYWNPENDRFLTKSYSIEMREWRIEDEENGSWLRA